MTAVVDTKTANLASMLAALRRVGLSPTITQSPEEVAKAERVVLPGVGAFGAGMATLAQLGLGEAIRERVKLGRPLLAVCLGLQLLCRSSEETPGVAGLGVLPVAVGRFVAAPTVPQLGWNRVLPAQPAHLVHEGHAYFANSFRITEVPPGWVGSFAEHGERFVAALEHGPMLACQFHPELSGAWGHALLERWRDAC